MSKISDVYDAYVSLCRTELASYTRIPNGLDIVGSGGIHRCKGFAVTPLDSINTERFVDCKMSVIRNFSISLVNQMTATVNDAAGTDSVYKDLMESAFLLQSAVEKSTVLNDSSNGLGVSKFVDDTGVFFLSGEREKYVQLDINFETEFFIQL